MADEKEILLDENGLAETSGILTVYNFNPETGLYTGSTLEFLAKGVGIPENSTGDAPLPCDMGKACIFRDGGWQRVNDHRGETVYNTVTGEAMTLTLPGDYPAGTTSLKPITDYDKWNGDAWVTDISAQRVAAVKAAEAEKSERIIQIRDVTQAWQTQLMLGIINDADKASLTQWMRYYQQVQTVDTSSAPDIEWPQKPA